MLDEMKPHQPSGTVMLGNAVREHAFAQRFDHMVAVQAPGHADGQALPRELVEQWRPF